MREKRLNRYGLDMSTSNAYWLDCTGRYETYKLRRGYKECGCYSGVCGCDFDIKGEDIFIPVRTKEVINRRLLLALR